MSEQELPVSALPPATRYRLVKNPGEGDTVTKYTEGDFTVLEYDETSYLLHHAAEPGGTAVYHHSGKDGSGSNPAADFLTGIADGKPLHEAAADAYQNPMSQRLVTSVAEMFDSDRVPEEKRNAFQRAINHFRFVPGE